MANKVVIWLPGIEAVSIQLTRVRVAHVHVCLSRESFRKVNCELEKLKAKTLIKAKVLCVT